MSNLVKGEEIHPLDKYPLTAGSLQAIMSPIGIGGFKTMLLKTRVFDLCPGRYKNLSELAQVMGISVSQVYRVQEGKRNINCKFIIGAIKAFPGCSFDDLFYFVPEVPTGKDSRTVAAGSRRF
jgi:hypothetical protein